MQLISDQQRRLLRDEQLDIIIGYACNARCPHCIQDIRYQSPVASDEAFLERFEDACDYYFNEIGGRKVIITGGEPSMFPFKMLGILSVLQKFPKPEFVATYTNGSGLLRNVPGSSQTLLEAAAEAGLTDINLSVHHFEGDRNRRFHRIPDLPPAERIAAEAAKTGLALRLNCNLIAENIGDSRGLISYMEWAKALAPKDVYFRDLHRIQDRPGSIRFAKKIEKLIYVDEQRVDFERIVADLLCSGEFEYLGKLGGKHQGQGEEYNFDHQGITVRVGYIEIGNENREQPTYFVFSPDGGLYADWNGPGSLHNLPINRHLTILN